MRDLIRAVLLQPRLDLFGCQAASTSFESRERFFGRAVTYLRSGREGCLLALEGAGRFVISLFMAPKSSFVCFWRERLRCQPHAGT